MPKPCRRLSTGTIMERLSLHVVVLSLRDALPPAYESAGMVS